MSEDVWSHFGNWWAVALWVTLYGILLLFLPFYRKSQRKPAGAFLAFIVAFAVEMFGIPLSLYFVLWAFGFSLPEGFLWGHSLVRYVGFAGTYACLAFTAAGGALIIAGWRRIHREYWSAEEGEGRLVAEGLYSRIRHPQYAGFLVISLGVLLEWATLPLLVLWPVLCVIYYRLAKKEEAEMAARFGEAWNRYKEKTGMFIPRIRLSRSFGTARAVAFALAMALSGAILAPASAEGFTWKSYAESGLGASFAGGKAKALLALDSGIILGDFELGSSLILLPLEFGGPDLIQEGAARFGATVGYRLDLGAAVTPFSRIAVGQIGLGRVPEGGSGDLTDFRKSFNVSFVLGLEVPFSGRWAGRAWASYALAPDAEAYDGGSLSGLELGVSVRATWETTIR
jgi:methanethiol S-methyltransferase